MIHPTTADDLLQLVRQSRLLDDQKLDDYIDRSKTPLPKDTKGLAGAFVRDGLLTAYQAEQLLHGRFRGFELGKYKILDRIGSGGMGQVFLAEHVVMRRQVALKVLPPKQAANPLSLERFIREARAAGALAHPNIVHAYDIDEHRGIHFLVMEFVDGRSLQEIVERNGPLTPTRAGYYLLQAAIGLHHAHSAGLVHRDVKPANLLLDRTGVVKLLDLGLAMFFQERADLAAQGEDGKDILGTADFLAPEQGIDSLDVDFRADLYSLGATGFYLLAGKPPFAGSTTQKLLAHQMKEPRPMHWVRPDVPEDLAAVIARLMKKDPKERYQSAAEVVQALDRFAEKPPAPPGAREMPPIVPTASASSRIAKPKAGARVLAAISARMLMPRPAPPRRTAAALLLLAAVVLGMIGGVSAASWWTEPIGEQVEPTTARSSP